MAYEITASRKRPQTFDEIVGQDFFVATLKNSIVQQRIAHAYLFSGPRGVGKTSAARILSKALNCETGPTENPCGQCSNCREISQGNSLDVIEIDGASNTSVNDVREIKDEVLFTPNKARYKVYIIDEVHMLSNSAFNALLKTIEEPPPYIVFIFATTEIHKVPATIRSRCQQFNFRLISIGDIRDSLIRAVEEIGVDVEGEALLWIARESTGSLRDAYTLLDQIVSFSGGSITLAKIREKLGIVGTDELNDLFELLLQSRKKEVLEKTGEMLDRGVATEQLVSDLVEYFRNILFIKHGIRSESLLGYSASSFSEEAIQSIAPSQIEKGLELLLGLHRRLRFSLNQRFELELVMARLAELDRLITEEELLGRLEKLRSGSSELPPATQIETNKPLGEKDDFVSNLSNSLKKDKPSLSSALNRARKCTLKDNIVRVLFDSGDSFFGELIIKDRNAVSQNAREILGHPVEIQVDYSEESGVSPEIENQENQVNMVKRVFRGEIMQGE